MGLKDYLIIAAIVIFIIIIIVLILYYLNNSDRYLSRKLLKKKGNDNNLIEISYSNSGDSNGNIDFLTIDLLNNKMKTEYRTYHSEPIVMCEYDVSKDINKIVDKIKKYNLNAYKNLPLDTSLIALDRAIKTLTLVYVNNKDKEYITIDFNMRIPPTARKRLIEVVNDINNLKNISKLIKKKKEK